MPNDPPTRLTNLIAQETARLRKQNLSSENLPVSTSVKYVERRASRSSITWLSKAARCVENAIHEFWSSIIFAHATRQSMSRGSSPTDIVGDQSGYVLKFGSVVSFAPIATDYILQGNWGTMPMMTSPKNCSRFTSVTISESRTEEIVDGLEAGTLDYEKVTMSEWLQVSYLMLYHGQELHIDQQIVYGGCVYRLHACVEAVSPAAGSVEELRNKQ